MRASRTGRKTVSVVTIASLILMSFPAGFAFAETEALIDDTHSSGVGSFGDSDDGFGGSEIPGWDEEGLDEDSTTIAEFPTEDGNDSASPNGGLFAKIGYDGDDEVGEWVCREVDAEGYGNLTLSYYWRGDANSNNEDGDEGIVEYRAGSGDCDVISGWEELQSHDMSEDVSWSAQGSFTLPDALDNTEFRLRFRNNADQDDKHFRVDGVLLTGENLGSISGYKYDQDEYEGWVIVGWVIWLYDHEADEWYNTETDGEGYYEFVGLFSGDYSVCEESQDGWQQLYPEDAEVSGVCADEFGTNGYDITIENGEDWEDVYFENAETIELYGYKFHDVNRDGEWYYYGEEEEEEPGLSGWTIYATPMNEEEVCEGEGEEQVCEDAFVELVEDIEGDRVAKTAVTNEEDEDTEEGTYTFEFLSSEEGWWRISEEERFGWSQTYPGGVIEEEEDPYYYDVYIEEYPDYQCDEGPGYCEDGYYNYNFGNWRWPIVEIFKWNDANRDGVQDESESPVADYPVAVGRHVGQRHIDPPSEDDSEEPQQPTDVIQTEIIAMQLTGSNGIAVLPLNPDWFGGFEGLDQALEQGLMAFEGELDGWVKTYPTQSHDDEVDLLFREGLEPAPLFTDSFFDVFTEIDFDEGVMNQGWVHGTESELQGLSFGNYQLLVISGEEAADVDETSATITWFTDRPGTSRVVYDTVSHGTLGDAPNYGYAFSTDTFDTDTKVTSHSVSIGGLEEDTTYFFRTISSASPESVSGESSFGTSATPVPSTSPSSGGGGGGSAIATQLNPALGGGSTQGQVLGVTTETDGSAAACEQYLHGFLRPGRQNDQEQVRRLQTVLRNFEGAAIEVNGVYDEASIAAVHAFQMKYAASVLHPWGLAKSTGFVYLTTSKKVSEVFCNNTRTFELTPEEQAIIDRYRGQSIPASVPVAPKSAEETAVLPKEEVVTPSDAIQPTTDSDDSQVGAVAASREDKASSGGGIWGAIKRLFGFGK